MHSVSNQRIHQHQRTAYKYARHTAMIRELFEDCVRGLEALLELPILVVVEDLLEEAGLLGGQGPGRRGPGWWHDKNDEESKNGDEVEGEDVCGGSSHSELSGRENGRAGKTRDNNARRASHVLSASRLDHGPPLLAARRPLLVVSSPVMVAQTRTAGQSSPKKLRFRDKLIGKGLTTDALQKKLKQLHQELAEMDQEHVDVPSLNAIRKDLISTSILLHKDRGVKAYAACCLADLLRLYAPDAPYNQNELRDIFQFFFRQLSTGLKGADSAYYNEYFHLLESLSTVKSVVLVCDLPNGDELMVDIFRDFFGLVRRDLPKKIELFMADILIALIDECQSLPSEVLETIMAQFTDKNAVRPLSRNHLPFGDDAAVEIVVP